MKNKKNRKKIITLIIMICILLCIPIFNITKIVINNLNKYDASNYFSTALASRGSTVLKSDETITIDVRIPYISMSSGDVGLGAFQAKFKYDTSLLTLNSYTSTTMDLTISDNVLTALDKSGGTQNSSFVLATLVFSVNPNISSQKTTISLTDIEGSNGILATSNDASLELTIDNDAPTVTFTPNGNSTAKPTQSTVVNVSDNLSGVSSTLLKYLWSSSSTLNITSFNSSSPISFTSGSEITTPQNLNGNYYLYISATDLKGNTVLTKSNTFNLNNGGPTCNIVGNPTSFISSATLKIVSESTNLAENAYSWDDISYSSVTTKDINTNGLYTAYVKDMSGNIGTCSVTVDKITSKKPSISLEKESDLTPSKTKNVEINITDSIGLKTNQQVKYGWSLSKTIAPTTYEIETLTNSLGAKEAKFTATASNLNGDYYLWIIPVSLTNTAENSLTDTIVSNGIFIFDNLKPICTWSETPRKQYLKENDTTVYILECTDLSSQFSKSDILASEIVVNKSGNANATVKSILKSNITNGYRYEITLTSGAGDGSLSLTLPKSSIKDIALNENDLVSSEEVLLDNTTPTCSITGNPTTWIQSSILSVSGNDSGSGLDTKPYSWDGVIYNAELNKNITSNASYKAYVKDNSGNVGTCSANVTKIDTEKPACTWISGPSKTPLVSGQTSNYVLQCTDNSNSFKNSDINKEDLNLQLTDDAKASINNIAKSSITNGYKYDISVTAGTGDGTLKISLPSNKIVDTANNSNELKTSNQLTINNSNEACEILGSPENWSQSATLNISTNITSLSALPYSWDGTNYTTDLTKNVTENGAYTAYVKQQNGTVTTCSVVVSKIDAQGPTVAFGNDGSTVYKKEQTTAVTVSDKSSGVEETELKYVWKKGSSQPTESEFLNSFENNDILSLSNETGTDYYLWIMAQDKAGNKTIKSTKAFYIDNINPTKPIITGNVSSGTQSNGTVILTLSGSTALSGISKYKYSIDNGNTWFDYDSTKKIELSENGTYNVIAKSISGVNLESENSNAYSVTIANKKMSLDVSKSISTVTNENVLVTIKSTTQLNSIEGWTLSSDKTTLKKEYTQNTKETVVITDIYGNEQAQDISITNIDKTLPILKVSYEKNKTQVVVTVTANEKMQSIEGWTLSSDELSLSKTYYLNQSVTVDFKDTAGNKVSESIVIDGIEKIEFKPIVNYSYNTDETVTITISSGKKFKQINGWTLSSDGYSLTKIISADVNEKLDVESVDNDKETVELKYSFPTKMNIKLRYNITTLTNQSVLVTITSDLMLKEKTGWTLSEDKKTLSKMYSENVSVVEKIISSKGIENEVNIKIENIDKELPKILDYESYKTYKLLKFSFSESLKQIIIEKDGKVLEYNSETQYTDPGTYYVAIEDNAGNISKYVFEVKNDTIQTIEVPNTGRKIILYLIIGSCLTIIGFMTIKFGFKRNPIKKHYILIFAIASLTLVQSIKALSSTQFELNGYEVKTIGSVSYLKNIESNTTVAILQQNLNSNTITVKRGSDTLSGNQLIYSGDELTISTTSYGTTNSVSYRMIINGDCDSNGTVTSSDLLDLVRRLSFKKNYGSITLSDILKETIDYNRDSYQDLTDIYLINKRIKKGYTIKTKGLSSDVAGVNLKSGQTYQFTTTKYPVNSTQGISYSSSNTNIATVSSTGLITAKSAGTTSVTVQSGSVVKTITVTVTATTPTNRNNLYVININSGGDAMILESNGHYGMIDTGTSSAYSKISKKLNELGVTKLDFMLITHNHSDHIGSALQIATDYKVENLYIKQYAQQDIVANADDEATTATHEARAKRQQDVIDKVNTTGGSVKYISSSQRDISMGIFNIKIFNVTNHFGTMNCAAESTDENINSATQLITATINGKTSYTYLEGDLNGSSVCTLADDSESNYNGDIKTVVYNQVLTSMKNDGIAAINNDKVSVYKAAHHGYFNSTNTTELNALSPTNTFATSSQETISSKTQSTKLRSIQAIYNYYGKVNFANNFKVSSEIINIDYSTGTPKMTGGASWDLSTTPLD